MELDISKEEKYLIGGIILGLGITLLILNNKNKKEAKDETEDSGYRLTNGKRIYANGAYNTLVGLRTPTTVSWDDFNYLISDKDKLLSAYTNAQLLDENNKAYAFLVNTGWIDAFEKFSDFIPYRTYNQMIMFAHNLNGAYSLIPKVPTGAVVETTVPSTTTTTTILPPSATIPATPVCSMI